MKEKIIKLGYTLSLIFLLSSLLFRSLNQDSLVQCFMIIGGFLLFVTSIFKIFVDIKTKK